MRRAYRVAWLKEQVPPCYPPSAADTRVWFVTTPLAHYGRLEPRRPVLSGGTPCRRRHHQHHKINPQWFPPPTSLAQTRHELRLFALVVRLFVHCYMSSYPVLVSVGTQPGNSIMSAPKLGVRRVTYLALYMLPLCALRNHCRLPS